MIALSPSRMSDLPCPHLFNSKYITKSFKEPESPQMKIGHEIHAFIADYENYCLEMRQPRCADWFWGKFHKLKELGKWTDPERAHDLAKIYMRSEIAEVHVPEGSDWVMVEKQMCFDENLNALPNKEAWFDTSGKTMFRLIVDYAYRQGDTIRIIDHKTGRATPSDEQLGIYAAMVPRYVPALQMGGVWCVEPIYNLIGGFKPDTVRLDVMNLQESRKGLDAVRDALNLVNNIWPEKYGTNYPAIPCGLCERCTVPTCPIRKDIMESIEKIPEAPVFQVPPVLENTEQAQKAITFITFIGQLEKSLKELLRAYVDQNGGAVVSGGMQAAYSESETFEIPDLGALIDLLMAFGVTRDQLLATLSITKTDLQKLVKKACLKDRMPMIEQMTVSKISRRFNIKKAA